MAEQSTTPSSRPLAPPPPPLTDPQREMVRQNLGLVSLVTSKFFGRIRIEDMLDLQQYLHYYLCRRVQGLDPTRTTRASTYLVSCLKQDAKRYMEHHGWMIKMPMALVGTSSEDIQRLIDDGNPLGDLLSSCQQPDILEESTHEHNLPDLSANPASRSTEESRQLLRTLFLALPYQDRILLAAKMRSIAKFQTPGKRSAWLTKFICSKFMIEPRRLPGVLTDLERRSRAIMDAIMDAEPLPRYQESVLCRYLREPIPTTC